MSDLNEKLAQEAAELINGGEWRDGKWYSEGHRDAWRRALKPAADRIEKLEGDVGVLIAASIRLSSRIDLDSDHYVDRIEKLEAALLNVMVGGNHVALLIGVGHPPHTATHDKALTHYGAGDAYDAWCCWKTIMEARKALEGKDD